MAATSSELIFGGKVSCQLDEELRGDGEGVATGLGGKVWAGGIGGDMWIELHLDQSARSLAHTGDVVWSSPGGSKRWMFWSSICIDEKASPKVKVQS